MRYHLLTSALVGGVALAAIAAAAPAEAQSWIMPGSDQETAQMRAAVAAEGAALLRDPRPATAGEPETRSSLLDRDPVYRAWLATVPAVETLRTAAGSQRLRSIGGNPIHPGETHFREVVAQIEANGETICSGVVVGANVILTAAHCFCDLDAGQGQVVIGNHVGSDEMQRLSLAGSKRYAPPQVQCHPSGGVVEATMRGRDAGVIVLAEDLPQSVVRGAPRLIGAQMLQGMGPRDQLFITGFGRRVEGDSTSAGLKNFLLSPVISPRCERPMDATWYPDCVAGQEMIAIERHPETGDGVGPCYSDSGGAAFLRREGAGGHDVLYLAGLVSRLLGPDQPCGNGAIYTLLTPSRVATLEQEAARRGGAPFRR